MVLEFSLAIFALIVLGSNVIGSNGDNSTNFGEKASMKKTFAPEVKPSVLGHKSLTPIT